MDLTTHPPHGYNLSANGIDEEDAEWLLNHIVDRISRERGLSDPFSPMWMTPKEKELAKAWIRKQYLKGPKLRLDPEDKKPGADRKDPDHQMFIGYGYNVTKLGFPLEFAEHLLRKRLAKADGHAREFCKNLGGYDERGEPAEGLNVLSNVRQRVVVNMAYNMGKGGAEKRGLGGFRGFQAGLEKGDFDKAVTEMFDSNWAGEVQRGRVLDLAFMMKHNRTFDKNRKEDQRLRRELEQEMDSVMLKRKRGPALNPPT